jgi:hypothetical protein
MKSALSRKTAVPVAFFGEMASIDVVALNNDSTVR